MTSVERTEQSTGAAPIGAQPWAQAYATAHSAGLVAALPTVPVPLPEADGTTLASALVAGTDLPAFRTSSVDGWAVRGKAPWRIVGRVLAGSPAPELSGDGTCMEIATGAMVPASTDHILRVEHSSVVGDLVTGEPRAEKEWREPGEECARGEELFPAGTPVTPGLIGVAAASGYDTLTVRRAPGARLIIFGDELLTEGPPGGGRIRDALGPSVPAWLRRFGAHVESVTGPVRDTLTAHVEALTEALAGRPALICTTGGTMHGPVDHLHPALARLGARYLVNTVEVRPGFPMLLARVVHPDGGTTLLAGLPGNPQSAVVALASLVAPALDGLRGRVAATLGRITLAEPVPARGGYTHLALVARGPDGLGHPVRHVGSAMLRGLARAAGFAIIPPYRDAPAGCEVDLLPLPLHAGE